MPQKGYPFYSILWLVCLKIMNIVEAYNMLCLSFL